jgi:hypothetical protein
MRSARRSTISRRRPWSGSTSAAASWRGSPNERTHENRLLGEVLSTYTAVRRRLGLGPLGASPAAGGLENAWTLAPSDVLALA